MTTDTVSVSIEIHQLESGRRQATCHNPGKPFHHLVAKLIVGLVKCAQLLGIKTNQSNLLERQSTERPAIWREQPSPPQDLTLVQGLHDVVGAVSDI